MGILHDQISEKVTTYFINIKKEFGNRYIASKIPFFPRPDIVLLGRSKEPMPQIALEVKPPHALKREYLTGLGQAVSYLMTFPLVYIVLPDEEIDGLHIPTFIKEIVEKSELKIGIIGYNISSYTPEILKKAELQEKINVKALEDEIGKSKPRSWLFWMDTNLEEVAQMLKKIADVESRSLEGDIKTIVLDEIWDEVLRYRYPNTTKPASFKLNYKLFLDTLNLWTGHGKLTVLGNRICEICKKYGEDSIEFKDALHYVILTEGGYLRMLILIDKIQNLNNFERKGTPNKINKIINDIREELARTSADISEDEDVLPIYAERANNCWMKIIGIELFKMGYGRSLTQINEELERRFSTYFQNQLKTGFFLSGFKKNKGLVINWEKIIDLIEKGDKNLDIF